MADKRPSFQFYPGDWLRDPSVRAVSYAARGLWTDMLCLMHESDRRGYLQLNGKPVTAEQLARMTGGSTDDVSRLLQELETSGVFSCTEHGMIYSRRMVRDEQKREKCIEAGRRGGNPTLKGDLKGHPKGVPKRNPTPSSSSSTSVVASATNPPTPQRGKSPRLAITVDALEFPPGMDGEDVRLAVGDWLAHKRSIGKGYRSIAAVNGLIAGWLMRGPKAFVEAIRHSIGNNFQGVYAPSGGGFGSSANNNAGRTDPSRVRGASTDSDFANIPVRSLG